MIARLLRPLSLFLAVAGAAPAAGQSMIAEYVGTGLRSLHPFVAHTRWSLRIETDDAVEVNAYRQRATSNPGYGWYESIVKNPLDPGARTGDGDKVLPPGKYYLQVVALRRWELAVVAAEAPRALVAADQTAIAEYQGWGTRIVGAFKAEVDWHFEIDCYDEISILAERHEAANSAPTFLTRTRDEQSVLPDIESLRLSDLVRDPSIFPPGTYGLIVESKWPWRIAAVAADGRSGAPAKDELCRDPG